jgi:hypothetical protein
MTARCVGEFFGVQRQGLIQQDAVIELKQFALDAVVLGLKPFSRFRQIDCDLRPD